MTEKIGPRRDPELERMFNPLVELSEKKTQPAKPQAQGRPLGDRAQIDQALHDQTAGTCGVSSTAPATGSSNASRTQKSDAPAPPSAGVSALVKKASARPSSAALISRQAPDGTKLEVLKGSSRATSSQVDTRAQVVEATIPLSSTVQVKAQALETKLHAGTDNPDGSTGLNFGGGGSVAALELSYSDGARSMSIGVSAWGGGWGFSAGERDVDQDGFRETCVSLDAVVATGALCVEDPGPTKTDRPDGGGEGAPGHDGSGGTSGR